MVKFERFLELSSLSYFDFDLDGKSSTIVNVNIYLRSINDIDDYKMVSMVLLLNILYLISTHYTYHKFSYYLHAPFYISVGILGSNYI